MDYQHLEAFDNRDKAVLHAIWLGFKYRTSNILFGVIEQTDDKWVVVDHSTVKSLGERLLKTPKNHSKMSYEDIRNIKMDYSPLKHWEELTGRFSTMHGELLRYILHTKVPLEKLIRYELALRGYDENHHWCGFEKAKRIWLKK
jgi:hypothetical protein